jgi:hypothetical protein
MPEPKEVRDLLEQIGMTREELRERAQKKMERAQRKWDAELPQTPSSHSGLPPHVHIKHKSRATPLPLRQKAEWYVSSIH